MPPKGYRPSQEQRDRDNELKRKRRANMTPEQRVKENKRRRKRYRFRAINNPDFLKTIVAKNVSRKKRRASKFPDADKLESLYPKLWRARNSIEFHQEALDKFVGRAYSIKKEIERLKGKIKRLALNAQ